MCRGDGFEALNVKKREWLSLLQIATIAPCTDKVIIVDSHELPDLAAIIAEFHEAKQNVGRFREPLLSTTPVRRFLLCSPSHIILLHTLPS